tara:strand:+ start:2699 stop:3400 length:702 start_codon:yes stop_codon:yes gene_type:complete
MLNIPRVLITGTSKGIGKDLVKYFLGKNYFVFGCSRSSPSIDHKNYKHFELDISNENSVKKMFMYLRKNSGNLDILINNAGLASMNHTLLTPLKKTKQIIDTNFIGTFLVSRESAKLMKKNNYGRIVNMTTVGTQIKLEGEAIYTASKSAVENLTTVMSREFANYGITVNALGPTPTYTDLIKFVPKEKIENIMNSLAFERLTEIKDIINVINFFISKESDYVTGQFIYLGGG